MNRLARVLTSLLIVEVGVIACLLGIKKLDEKLSEMEKDAKKDAEELYKRNFGEDAPLDEKDQKATQESKESKLDATASNPKEEAAKKKTDFEIKAIDESLIKKVGAVKPVRKANKSTPAPTATDATQTAQESPVKAEKPAAKKKATAPAKKTVKKPVATTDKQEVKEAKPKTARATKPKAEPKVEGKPQDPTA